MKKTLLILSAIFLFFAGCKKDDVIEASKVEVKNEVIEEGSNYIKINAEYVYPEEMAAVSLYLSEQENMSDAKVYECKMEGKSFSVEANGLKENKKYHYCYEFDNGYEKKTVYGEQRSFTTLEEDLENQVVNVNGVSFTMIAVKGGTFQMGATSEQGSDANSNEYPVHSVTLSSYYIGETEVTQELWEAVMGSNPSFFSGNPQRPVEKVSWNDCKEFITNLNNLTGMNFRLPTEAEWEYAARGGNESQGYKYSGSNTIGNVAWYSGNSGDATHNVKTKSPNELGIYDMSGNVYEWCEDWLGDYSSGSQTNPTGPSSGSRRVLRGGNWIYSAVVCRVSARSSSNDPDYGRNYYGFRLALSQ